MLPRPLIAEWSPITLDGPTNEILGIKIHVHLGFIVFSVLALIIALKFLIQKKKPDWVMVLLFAVMSYLGVKHQRHTSFLILAGSSLLYPQIISIFSPMVEFLKNKFNENTIKFTIWGKNTLTFILLGAFVVFLVQGSRIQLTSLTVYPSYYPVGSYEFIKQNNLSGNLATTYNWGSYALWKLYPQCRVLIDGRYEEVYSYKDFLSALDFSEHVDNNWADVFNRIHTDIIVLPKRAYSRNDLLELKNWTPVYADMVSIVLLPSNKVRYNYIYPNPNDRIYWHEDFSKNVNLN